MHENANRNQGSSRWKKTASTFLGLILLVSVGWIVFGRTLNYEFIYDDYLSIVENESIRKVVPLFGDDEEPFGPLRPSLFTPLEVRPAVNLTFALDYHFSKLDPSGYRLTNIIGHILTAVILWWIVLLTLRQPVFGGRFERSSKTLGLLAAIVWMVHPGNQESVVYLAQRTELQMGLFYALTVLLAISYWQTSSWPVKAVICISAALSSTCGMLSKEMMASAPAMIAVYEWTIIGGSIWTIFRRSWPLHLALFCSWLPLAAIYLLGFCTPMAGFNNVISAYDFWITQSETFFYYWKLTFYPKPLLIHYYVPTLHSVSEAWLGVIGFFAYAAVTTYLVWRRSVIGFAMLWFFAVLSPTLIVPLPYEELSERRLYATLLAVIPVLTVLLALGVSELVRRIRTVKASETGIETTSKIYPAGYLVVIAIIAAFVVYNQRTLPRLEKSSELWGYVLKEEPDNMFALAYNGAELCKLGDFDTGIDQIMRAYESNKEFLYISNNLIKSLDFAKRYDLMLDVCREQYEMFPDRPSKVHCLAVALERNGLVEEAMEKYREAIKLKPNAWDDYAALAMLLAETGRPFEAIPLLETSVSIKNDCMNCNNLFLLYLNTQQAEKALALAPKLLKATRKEKSTQEAEQLERDIKQFETQIREIEKQKAKQQD